MSKSIVKNTTEIIFCCYSFKIYEDYVKIGDFAKNCSFSAKDTKYFQLVNLEIKGMPAKSWTTLYWLRLADALVK